MKTTRYFLLVLSVLTAVSCTVDVPDDHNKTQLSFYIKGDGFEHTFTETDDFDSFHLNVKDGVDYEFLLSGSNQNRLGSLAWAWNTESIKAGLELDDLTHFPNLPDRWRDLLRLIYYGVGFDTDPSEVTTTVLLTGSVTFYNIADGPARIDLDFSAGEFTGPDGSGSSVAIPLVAFIGNGPTELISLD